MGRLVDGTVQDVIGRQGNHLVRRDPELLPDDIQVGLLGGDDYILRAIRHRPAGQVVLLTRKLKSGVKGHRFPRKVESAGLRSLVINWQAFPYPLLHSLFLLHSKLVEVRRKPPRLCLVVFHLLNVFFCLE